MPLIRDLETFLWELSGYSLVDEQQETDLARRAQDGDEIALDKLCRCNARVVVAVALRYRRPGYRLSADVIAEGMYGLVRTAHRFEAAYGVRFIHVAVWGIHFAILEAMPELGPCFAVTTRPVLHIVRPDGTMAHRSARHDYGGATTGIDRLASELASPVAETVDLTLRARDDGQAQVLRLYAGLCHEGPRTSSEIEAALGIPEAEVLHMKDRALRALRNLAFPSLTTE